MKVGSLVKCIRSTVIINPFWEGTPAIAGEIYTIRDLLPNPSNGAPVIYLEEMKNAINTFSGKEYGYSPDDFREIQPPMEVSLEQILQETLHA